MNERLRRAALALAFGAAPVAQATGVELALAPSPVAASAPAGAGSARAPGQGDALANCETAVGNSIREVRGKLVQGLQFDDDARAGPGDGAHVEVKGAGHYRRGGGRVAFRYSCVFDPASGGTSGVLFHDTDAGPAPALPVWKADLSRLSPEVCEGAVASSLQSTHPRAGSIVFDGDTRKLEQGSQGGTVLAGTGRVTRAPGMQAGAFQYRCEFDAAGRIVGAHATD